MAKSIFPKVPHDWLKHETDPVLGRRAGTIKSGAGVIACGQVLGKVTATGKYTVLAPTAEDGSEAAAAIAIAPVDATAADAETAILVRDAQIVPAQLTWPAGITTNQKNAALVQLAALNIVDLQR